MLSKSSRALSIAGMLAFSGVALAQPANDDCGSPESIGGFGQFSFDTTGATTAGPSTSCGPFASDIQDDVWFCWTASESGPVSLSLCGGDVAFDSTIAVYSSCDCPSGEPFACNDDSCGLQSAMSFLATAGQQYMIRVGGYSPGEQGTGTLAIASGIVHTAVNPANGHTYHLFSADTWTDAEGIAMSLGGHLVTINDDAENEWVRAEMLGFDGEDRRTWLGFNDAEVEGEFAWSSGETPGYTNWNGGEPNDSGGIEDYAEMFGSNGQWNDQPDDGNGFVHFGVVELAGDDCPADFDGDGFVTGLDFDLFVGAYEAGDMAADFDGDGFITGIDFDLYVFAFEAGC